MPVAPQIKTLFPAADAPLCDPPATPYDCGNQVAWLLDTQQVLHTRAEEFQREFMHRRSATRGEDQGASSRPHQCSDDDLEPSIIQPPTTLTGKKSHPESDFRAATGEISRDIFFKGSLKKKYSWLKWGVALVVCLLFVIWLLRHDSVSDENEGYVTVAGWQFEKDCRPFYVAGFNAHDAVTAAMLTPSEYKIAGGKSGRDHIRAMFSQAAQAGLSLVRIWVHTDDPQFPFQVSPGMYNEHGFAALDFVLEEARRNGIKVLLSLIDNWKYYNGVDQFVDWSTSVPKRTQERPADKYGDTNNWADLDEETKAYEVTRHALFYNDTGCRQLYKEHVYSIVNRQNTFNGRLYRNDPTIFAWDLLNEPRCETWKVEDCGRLLQDWIEEMSQYVKTVDPNHLVTIGSEGFFKHGGVQDYLNPQTWAGVMGQDFLLNHIPKVLDFAAIHVWPDTWDRKEEKFEGQWIMSHVDTATFQLGKPVLVEEFGKKLSPNRLNPSSIRVLRDPVFKSTFSMIENLIVDGRAIGGSMFWKWDLPMFHGSDGREYGIHPEDTTFQIITQHTQFINQWINSQPPHPECELGCWVPRLIWSGRKCENIPHLCNEYWNAMKADKSRVHNGSRWSSNARVLVNDRFIPLDGLQVYTSRAACCRPGLGAFPKGCSWTTWVWS